MRLAMDDAGLVDKGKLAPKPSQLQHLISFAFNTRRSLAEVVASEAADQAEWLPEIEKVAAARTPAASSPATAWTTTTC